MLDSSGILYTDWFSGLEWHEGREDSGHEEPGHRHRTGTVLGEDHIPGDRSRLLISRWHLKENT
jgi:hypothetical protein